MNVFCKDTIEVCGLQITPIPLRHGRGLSHGFRFGKAAYLTDHSEVPESSRAMLQGLDVLFLDALRHTPHPTHSSVKQALEIVESLKPREAWFTHISHDLQHASEDAALPDGVHFAYDGLEVTVEA
jgi:phosphoribosyl 1,2-cyclic phosphate phosphodiesterase